MKQNCFLILIGLLVVVGTLQGMWGHDANAVRRQRVKELEQQWNQAGTDEKSKQDKAQIGLRIAQITRDIARDLEEEGWSEAGTSREYKNAIQLFKRVWELVPFDDFTRARQREAGLELAELYAHRGQPKEAIELYTRLWNLDPSDNTVHEARLRAAQALGELYLGEGYKELQDLKKAKEFFDAIVAYKTDAYFPRLQKMKADAQAHLQKIPEEEFRNVTVAAQEAFSQGRYQDALTLYLNIYRTQPTTQFQRQRQADAAVKLARIYEGGGAQGQQVAQDLNTAQLYLGQWLEQNQQSNLRGIVEAQLAELKKKQAGGGGKEEAAGLVKIYPPGENEQEVDMKESSQDFIALDTLADKREAQLKLGEPYILLRMVTPRTQTAAGVPFYADAHTFNDDHFGYPLNQEFDLKSYESHDKKRFDPAIGVQYFLYDPQQPEKGFQYFASYTQDNPQNKKFHNDVVSSPWYAYPQQYFLDYFYANQNLEDDEKRKLKKRAQADLIERLLKLAQESQKNQNYARAERLFLEVYQSPHRSTQQKKLAAETLIELYEHGGPGFPANRTRADAIAKQEGIEIKRKVAEEESQAVREARLAAEAQKQLLAGQTFYTHNNYQEAVKQLDAVAHNEQYPLEIRREALQLLAGIYVRGGDGIRRNLQVAKGYLEALKIFTPQNRQGAVQTLLDILFFFERAKLTQDVNIIVQNLKQVVAAQDIPVLMMALQEDAAKILYDMYSRGRSGLQANDKIAQQYLVDYVRFLKKVKTDPEAWTDDEQLAVAMAESLGTEQKSKKDKEDKGDEGKSEEERQLERDLARIAEMERQARQGDAGSQQQLALLHSHLLALSAR